MKQQYTHTVTWTSIVALIMAAIIISSFSWVYEPIHAAMGYGYGTTKPSTQTSTNYGYGYGTDDNDQTSEEDSGSSPNSDSQDNDSQIPEQTTESCNVQQPEQLNVKYKTKKIVLQWEADSERCTLNTSSIRYEVNIYDLKGNVVKRFANLASPQIKILYSDLKSNTKYRFAVRSISDETINSDWSSKQSFRTKPAKPNHIAVKRRATQLHIQWRAVKNSEQLRYYKVALYHNNKAIRSVKVSKHLGRKYISAVIKNVPSKKRYVLKLQAVYSKKLKSNTSIHGVW